MKAEQTRAEPERARKTSAKEYALRFAFGGIVTALVGVVGKAFGPSVAGLFLAFPAILPASVTLIEKHEHRKAAGRDAIGAAAGSVGLIGFAIVVWVFAPRVAAWIVLLAALAVWLVISLGTWWIAMQLRDWERVG
jgi:preprotein translocase subunit Sss1